MTPTAHCPKMIPERYNQRSFGKGIKLSIHTNNLKIICSLNPNLVADYIFVEALRIDRLEEWRNISDTEQYISFREKTYASEDEVAHIGIERRKRIGSEHVPNDTPFARGFLVRLMADELIALAGRQVGPILSSVVGIVRIYLLVE